MYDDVKHAISDDLLMGYAAGVLPLAFDLVVASHVSLSDDARVRLAEFEAVGGSVLSGMKDAPLAPGSLEMTIAKLDNAAPEPPRAPSTGVFPTPLQDAVGGDESAVAWRSVGMGVKQCVLHSDDDATARLLLIPAGQAMPKHTHRGTEITLVLKGAYADEDGRFARGDIEIADYEVDHAPVAEMGEDCICLIASDARVRFQGLIPRLAQPFIGI